MAPAVQRVLHFLYVLRDDDLSSLSTAERSCRLLEAVLTPHSLTATWTLGNLHF